MFDMVEFIKGMPKAELHVHLEGTVEPFRTLELAKRNEVDFPYSTEEEILAAQDYGHPHLESFLNHHYMCLEVVRTGHDMYDITCDFLKKCYENNVKYVEIMFDPQTHLKKGMSFRDLITGIYKGLITGETKWGVKSNLMMCARREFGEEEALDLLDQARPYKDLIKGIGTDSHEDGNPPRKFLKYFKQAKADGYRLAAHCDVWRDESLVNIRECFDLIEVERIDHGVDVLDDSSLMKTALETNMPFTMCPTWRPSDDKPRRIEGLKRMLDLGLVVSVNTDDPTRFACGYMNNTLIEVQKHTPFTRFEMVQLMRNAFNSAWISEEEKSGYIKQLNDYVVDFGVMAEYQPIPRV